MKAESTALYQKEYTLSQSMQRCPNCGAYVMSDDNICPRCDHPLDDSSTRIDPTPDISDTNTNAAGPGGEITNDSAAETEESTPEDRANLPTTRLPNAVPVFDRARPISPGDTDHAETADQPGAPGADIEHAAASETTSPAAEEEASEPAEAIQPGAPGADAEHAAAGETTSPAAEEEASEPAEAIQPGAPGADIEHAAAGEAIPPAAEAIPELPEFAGWFEAASTQPHLEDQLVLREPDEPDDDDTSELPTARLAPGERAEPADVNQTVRQEVRPAYIVPPAPYTPPPTPAPPPPAWITPPPASYGYGYGMAAVPALPTAYLQQRVQAYRRGGYRLHVNSPYEATLSNGKGLGAWGWLLALISVIGLFWYVLLLALSGFQRDVVDIVLESDGQLYEDGSGAAHVRQQRSRVGRRWAMFGAVIFVVSLLIGIALGVVAGIVLSSERYQAALREAYPAITLFEEHFSSTETAPADVNLVKDGAVAYAIVAGIAAVGLWGGATLWVIGTIHAKAYRVHVPPWG
jgi:hypothetical protein